MACISVLDVRSNLVKYSNTPGLIFKSRSNLKKTINQSVLRLVLLNIKIISYCVTASNRGPDMFSVGL